MAGDSDLEKTESATPRRLQKAREEGQIARSRELSTFALLAAGFYGVWGMSGSMFPWKRAISCVSLKPTAS